MNERLNQKRLLHARLLALAAAVLWSTSGLFLKSPELSRLPIESRGVLLACYRALFAAGILALFLKPQTMKFRPALVPMVLIFSVMSLLFITAMTRTTAAAAIFLQYTSSIWAFVFGVFFLKEKLERANLTALLFVMAGICTIVAGDWNGENFTGNLIALCSGLSYAAVILFLRHLRSENSFWLIFLNHLVAGLILLPAVFWLHVPLSPMQWTLIAVMGVFQMGLPYVLFAKAVQHISVQEAALITLLEPILNPCWVWIFWGESVPESTLLGGGLIIAGLLARYCLFSSGQKSH